MLPSEQVVDLSRLQFGMTALYHFLFVPLTLGMSFILGIMETVYVVTKKPIWREMTKFWGILFGINFAMGVATGITMEFQFGTNWAYYSHYVGDIFGAPLAIEGMMAFFLEATFVGIFFFGWNRLTPAKHLLVTWLLALGTNLSALWILIANGWMQSPVGSKFNLETMRMEVSSFWEVLFNPVAQAKFVHTVGAGYVTGSMFILSISAYYLLRGRNKALAYRSIAVASAFGLITTIGAIFLGDESGYLDGQNQPMKLAAIESVWRTEKAPASLNLIGLPNQEKHDNEHMIQVPYLLGLLVTRSTSGEVPGILDIVEQNKLRIRHGQEAYAALTELQKNPSEQALRRFEQSEKDLGYGLLLKRYTEKVVDASAEQIEKAAWDTVPKVTPLFFAFRGMVGCGLAMLFIFSMGLWFVLRKNIEKRWFLWVALFALPLPWISCELGWFVAEYGRQPWAVYDMLPTFLGTSSLTSASVKFSVFGFILFYSVLAVVELFLMVKYIRLGPDGLKKPVKMEVL